MQPTFAFLPYLLFILFNVGLGLFVLTKNSKSEINRSFALCAFSFALWALSVYIIYNSKSLATVLFWGRAVFDGPIVLAVAFVYFSWVFPQKSFKVTRNHIIFLSLLSAVMLLIAHSNLLIEEVFFTEAGPIPIEGIGHEIFAIYFMACIAYALIGLIRKYRNTTGIQRNQIGYVFLGFSLSLVFGTTTNLIFPLLGTVGLTPLGPFLLYF